MLKRIAVLITAIALTVCATVGAMGVSAYAESSGSAEISVSFVNHDGTQADRVANSTFWAVIKLKNYASLIGTVTSGSTSAARGYDRAVVALSACIDFGSENVSVVANEWKSPYLEMNEHGEVSLSVDSTKLNILALADARTQGPDYAISAAQLDANDGELLRIKLSVSDEIDDNAQARLLSSTNVTLISKAAGANASAATFTKLNLQLGSPVKFMIGNGVNEHEPAVIDHLDVSKWEIDSFGERSSSNSVLETIALGGQGAQMYCYSTATYQDTFDLSEGFTFTFAARGRTGWGNYVESRNEIDMGVRIGDYLFCMRDYIIPEIWYGDTLLWRGAAIIGPDSEGFTDGKNGWRLDRTYRQNLYAYINGFQDMGSGTRVDYDDTEMASRSGSIYNCLYTITFDSTSFTFKKVVKYPTTSTQEQEFLASVAVSDKSSLENASIALVNESSNGNTTTFAGTKLTRHGHKRTMTTAATCTTSGLYEYENCAFCSETIADEVIPAAHAWRHVETKSFGAEIYECVECGLTIYDEGLRFNIADCEVTLAGADGIYSGSPLYPGVASVKYGSQYLTQGVHYEYEYIDTDKLGVGKVKFVGIDQFNGEKVVTFTIWAPGDVNGDGFVTAGDYTLLKGYVHGDLTINTAYLRCADMDSNEIVNNNDVVLLRQKLLKK